MRRYLACDFNLIELRKHAPNLYMWTLTFPYFAVPEMVRESVRQMIQWLNRHGASGVRVYELHKSGSLHIHLVTDKLFYRNDIWDIWRSLGGGFVHKMLIDDTDHGAYITKELMKKAQKLGIKAGTRVYSAFGVAWEKIGKTLVGNIRFVTENFVFKLFQSGGEEFSHCCTFNFNCELFGVGYSPENSC